MCVWESACSAFSLEFIYINNTSGKKTPHSLLFVVPQEFCSGFSSACSFNFSTESLSRVRNLSSRRNTETVAVLALRVLHATAASAKSLPCNWWIHLLAAVRIAALHGFSWGGAGGRCEQGVIFMKRGLGAFLPPRPVPFPRALMILLLFLKLQPNLLKPFSLMTNLNMAHWELRKGTTTSSLVASVRWTSRWGTFLFLLSTNGNNAMAVSA